MEPDDALYNHGLGYCLYKLLRDQGEEPAVPFLRAAVMAEPNNALYNLWLGCCLVTLSRCNNAEPFLRAAVQAEPDIAFYNYYLGDCLYRLSKYKDAEPFFRAAVKGKPDNTGYKDSLEHCLCQQGTSNSRFPGWGGRRRAERISQRQERDSNRHVPKVQNTNNIIQQGWQGYIALNPGAFSI